MKDLSGNAENAAHFAAESRRLGDFARWVVSLDDPIDTPGGQERRTVTLTKIIARAREALDTCPRCHQPRHGQPCGCFEDTDPTPREDTP